MQTIDMILQTPKEIMKILKEQPICNVRTIARRTKNTNDPNPMQSMISAISTKYPISVDKEKAAHIGITCLFIEVYQDQVYDLLAEKPAGTNRPGLFDIKAGLQ